MKLGILNILVFEIVLKLHEFLHPLILTLVVLQINLIQLFGLSDTIIVVALMVERKAKFLESPYKRDRVVNGIPKKRDVDIEDFS